MMIDVDIVMNCNNKRKMKRDRKCGIDDCCWYSCMNDIDIAVDDIDCCWYCCMNDNCECEIEMKMKRVVVVDVKVLMCSKVNGWML